MRCSSPLFSSHSKEKELKTWTRILKHFFLCNRSHSWNPFWFRSWESQFIVLKFPDFALTKFDKTIECLRWIPPLSWCLRLNPLHTNMAFHDISIQLFLTQLSNIYHWDNHFHNGVQWTCATHMVRISRRWNQTCRIIPYIWFLLPSQAPLHNKPLFLQLFKIPTFQAVDCKGGGCIDTILPGCESGILQKDPLAWLDFQWFHTRKGKPIFSSVSDSQHAKRQENN